MSYNQEPFILGCNGLPLPTKKDVYECVGEGHCLLMLPAYKEYWSAVAYPGLPPVEEAWRHFRWAKLHTANNYQAVFVYVLVNLADKTQLRGAYRCPTEEYRRLFLTEISKYVSTSDLTVFAAFLGDLQENVRNAHLGGDKNEIISFYTKNNIEVKFASL